MKLKVTERRKRFVDAFCGPANGNATKAAEMAGCPPRGARTQGMRMLRNVDVQQGIAARAKKREIVSIATAQERDEIRTVLARDSKNPFVRMKAVDSLDKVDRLNKSTSQGASLADILEQTLKMSLEDAKKAIGE